MNTRDDIAVTSLVAGFNDVLHNLYGKVSNANIHDALIKMLATNMVEDSANTCCEVIKDGDVLPCHMTPDEYAPIHCLQLINDGMNAIADNVMEAISLKYDVELPN